MASPGPSKAKRVFRIGNGEIVLGWKLWLALVGVVVIVWIGFASNPNDPGPGILAAISTVVGTLVGVALQFHPTDVDHSARAAGAIRGLSSIAYAASDTKIIVGQLLEATKENRTQAGLLSVQMDLDQVVRELQISMVQWDAISQGSLAAFEAEQREARELFIRLSKEGSA